MAAFIRSAWENQDISQKEVARDLGIHQSQFSKLVNGRFKEADGHAARLFEYSKQRQGAGGRARSPAVAETIRASLTERLMQAWDGTAEGARALEAILDGAARLRQARLRGR
jgi:transcriptional regulator with XRE-family HTH domain